MFPKMSYRGFNPIVFPYHQRCFTQKQKSFMASPEENLRLCLHWYMTPTPPVAFRHSKLKAGII